MTKLCFSLRPCPSSRPVVGRYKVRSLALGLFATRAYNKKIIIDQ